MNNITENPDRGAHLAKVFANNLLYYLSVGGKTREDLGKAIGVAYTTVCEWCKGTKFPRISALDATAEYLGVSKSDLIEERIKDEPKDEVWEMRAALQQRPELKTLFDLSKNATKDDVEKAISIIETLMR